MSIWSLFTDFLIFLFGFHTFKKSKKGEFYERSCEITNKKLVPHLFNKRKWDKLETVYLKTALIYGKLKAMVFYYKLFLKSLFACVKKTPKIVWNH